MVPEPFLWPVEVLMGPSAGHLGALLAEQGLPLSACAAAASPPVRCLPATTPASSGCWGRSCRGERGGLLANTNVPRLWMLGLGWAV
jgi:hypothetical protein